MQKGVMTRSTANTVLRRYQLEILHAAMKTNIIAFLGTGSGKTLIAVELMKRIARSKKRLMIFFAPTIHLVNQQAAVILEHTDLKVSVCHGQSDRGWNAQKWKTESTSKEVFVMTPQILYECLNLGFLNLNTVDLLIFDECHHASGGHPYARIMKDFYKNCQRKPKIFGMTASPLKRKGASSNSDCEDQIAMLEELLDSKVYMPEDKAELEEFVFTPIQEIRYYDNPRSLHDSLKLQLEKMIENNFMDEENLDDKSRTKMQRIYGNIIYCLENLGSFCAYEAIGFFIKESRKMGGSFMDTLNLFKRLLQNDVNKLCSTREGISDATEKGVLTPKVHALVKLILEERNVKSMRCIIFVERVVVAAVLSTLMRRLHPLLSVTCAYVSGQTSSSKGKKQHKILEDFSNGTVKLLVATDIVEEGIDVQSCSCVIRFDLPKTPLSFIQSRGRARQKESKFYLLVESGNENQEKLIHGLMRSEESMKETSANRNSNLTRCNEKECNVETDVYREDSMKETCLNIGSNHTRRNREECDVESDGYGENSMNETSQNRDSIHTRRNREERYNVENDRYRENSMTETSQNEYRVLSAGATIACDSNVNKFCAKLPGDEFCSPKALFSRRKVNRNDHLHERISNVPPSASFHEVIGPPTVSGNDNLHERISKLPPNAPCPEVTGPPTVKPTLPKKLVRLEECQVSQKNGALDEHLQPVSEESSEKQTKNSEELSEKQINNSEEMSEKQIMNSQESESEAETSYHGGISKRKELHSYKGYALPGTWGEKLSGVTLQVYKLYFTSKSNEKTYANFAFLIEEKLDEEVANFEIELFLPKERVNAKFLHCGDVELNSKQLKDAKYFHQTVFNAVFAKGLGQDKRSRSKTKKLWVSSNMYFLLPIQEGSFGACQREANIDWLLIRYFVSGAKLFKSLFRSEKGTNVTDDFDILLKRNFLQYSVPKEEVISLATEIHRASDLIDKAVIAVHTGRIYIVVRVISDKTSKSPFPQSRDGKAQYSSYHDYFEKKYGVQLKHLNQPLLLLKQTHRPYNLLVNHFDVSKEKEPVSSTGETNEANYVELPPELCLDLRVPSIVIRSLYLLPSVMYRLNSLVLAGQLGKIIRAERPKCPAIPARLMMEALTTSRCLESFSYERLELLGDSFLKYAVSYHLFLKYEKENEGYLSACRAELVSNATLHDLATTRNLQEYICEESFDARRWVAPGMPKTKAYPCRCNLEDLGKPGKEDNLATDGKSCDEGHRWMCPKTISDAVEALIGAHFVAGGEVAAFEFMKWMNMEVDFELDLADAACRRAFVDPSVLMDTNLHALESVLGYEFQNKALLVEAITHASLLGKRGYCYQRLEFLGDSVLDFLITLHFYKTYPRLSPGFLTDLRSSTVNNENFAWAAVKCNIQQYLHCDSDALLNNITNFVTYVDQIKEGKCQFKSFGGTEAGPKVLGDIIESIAGAIFLDTKFNFERVWQIMEVILSPIATPDTLQLQPVREVQEICSKNHWEVNWGFAEEEEGIFVSTVVVNLEDSKIVGKGMKESKRAARMVAAQQILLQMEERGLHHSRRNDIDKVTFDTNEGETELVEEVQVNVNEGIDLKEENVTASHICVQMKESERGVSEHQHEPLKRKRYQDTRCVEMEDSEMVVPGHQPLKRKRYQDSAFVHMNESDMVDSELEPLRRKKYQDYPVCDSMMTSVEESGVAYSARHLKSTTRDWYPNLIAGSGLDSNIITCHGADKNSIPCGQSGVSTVPSQKVQGGPRKLLHEICQKNGWPAPVFQCEELGNPHKRSYVSIVRIPSMEFHEVSGKEMRTKKIAQDAAAFMILSEFQKKGIISLDVAASTMLFNFKSTYKDAL